MVLIWKTHSPITLLLRRRALVTVSQFNTFAAIIVTVLFQLYFVNSSKETIFIYLLKSSDPTCTKFYEIHGFPTAEH